MSTIEDIKKNLSEVLKVPLKDQKPEVFQSLQAYRKQIADKFFEKSTPYQEKLAVFDDLLSLHQYFGYRLPKKPWQGGVKKTSRTTDEKKADIKDMLEFCMTLRNKFIESNAGLIQTGKMTQLQADILGGQIFNKTCDNWIGCSS